MPEATKKIEINAENKAVGRLATEVSNILQNKNNPNYEPNKIQSPIITILNISKLKISDKKLDENRFTHHSGYPGGLKRISWREVFSKSPEDLFLRIVKNMIPSNRHKKELMKLIKFQ